MRKQLADKGVTLDLDFVSIFQGVLSGGRDTTSRWGGSSELVLNLNTQKLRLWPGGFLLARAEVAFKHGVNANTGSLMPVNTEVVLPLPARDEVVLSHVVFTQFLSEWFGVTLGKLDTTGGDMNEFAHVRGNQFMNLAFSASPLVMRTAPYAPLGMGLIFLPTKNPQDAIVSFSVVDTEGTTTKSGFDTLFRDGTTLAAKGRLTIKPFGSQGTNCSEELGAIKTSLRSNKIRALCSATSYSTLRCAQRMVRGRFITISINICT